MNLHYWQYFLSLEADLANTTRFVEPAAPNMSCYSIEFARLLLAAGSEVDVLCKVLCEKHSVVCSAENIDGYRAAITSKFPGFTRLEIRIPRYNMRQLPWQSWDAGKTPEWWRAYNKVKHERSSSFASASLKNTLSAIAGVFVLASYVCHQEIRSRTAYPWPQILDLDPQLSPDMSTNRRPGHILPDFP